MGHTTVCIRHCCTIWLEDSPPPKRLYIPLDNASGILEGKKLIELCPVDTIWKFDRSGDSSVWIDSGSFVELSVEIRCELVYQKLPLIRLGCRYGLVNGMRGGGDMV